MEKHLPEVANHRVGKYVIVLSQKSWKRVEVMMSITLFQLKHLYLPWWNNAFLYLHLDW